VKSSERAPFVALLCIALSAIAISILRTRLVERSQRLRVKSDVYALPSADQLVVASLGYRSALADLLFTSTVISYSIHVQEKRRFEYVGNYLEAVMTLDPSFRTPFLYADTLVVLQALPARMEEYQKARELLERGMLAFPRDGEIWMNAAMYIAYLAAPHFDDPKLRDQWRLDGARIMAKACEFVDTSERIPQQCLAAAAIFSRAGEREASIRFLERLLAVSDDEEVRKIATLSLQRLLDEQQKRQVEQRQKRFRDVWREDLPFVSKNLVLVLGPRFDPARCAGAAAPSDALCATSWRAWNESSPVEAEVR
jgi:tetratricopeptide (TPR) repeat protein